MSAPHSNDEEFLRRALTLARQGVGLASPNPCVGAVIVDARGEIVGEGFHTYAGRKHAEILALEQAGANAAGATLFINLEPCSHVGRTTPCADAVAAASIRRVVACMQDPNPQVSGAGFARLRDAGMEISVGLLQEEARELNESFAKYIRTRTPLVTLKSAMTLDGKIAPPPTAVDPSNNRENRYWITGETARHHVQELRHKHDAILLGIGTILADDPLLTDRTAKPRRRPLLRVVLDSQLRLPLNSHLVKTAQDDVLVFCVQGDNEKKKQLVAAGVRVQILPSACNESRLDLAPMLHRLGEMEITSLMIEGGSAVNAAILASGLADKIFFYYAPRILAGDKAVPFAAGSGFSRISEAPTVHSIRLHRLGEDFAVEGYLQDPYANSG